MLEPLGGWNAFLSKDDNVILKPNLVSSIPRERNGTTDAAIVEALIRVCLDFGCRVQVADAAVFGSAASVAKLGGMLDVCRKYEVELKTLKNAKPFELGDRHWTLSSDLDWANKIINLPKLKGHCQVYYTGAVKNLFGCVVGRRKFYRHMHLGNKGNSFGQMLLDMARGVSPVLSIIDGIGAMAGDGPVNGTPVDLSLLALSTDPMALDWAIVDWLSGDKERIPYFQAALQDEYWKESCVVDINWIGEAFEPEGFFFPDEVMPIRFNPAHVIRSVMKSGLLRLRERRCDS